MDGEVHDLMTIETLTANQNHSRYEDKLLPTHAERVCQLTWLNLDRGITMFMYLLNRSKRRETVTQGCNIIHAFS